MAVKRGSTVYVSAVDNIDDDIIIMVCSISARREMVVFQCYVLHYVILSFSLAIIIII